MENNTERELTFGEKAVGLTFNPSGDEKVHKAKQLMAEALDLLNETEAEKTHNGNAMSSWEGNVFLGIVFTTRRKECFGSAVPMPLVIGRQQTCVTRRRLGTYGR